MKRLVATFAATLLAAGTAAAAPLTLKFQSADAAGSQVYEIQKVWTDGIEAASNGRFKIDLLPLDSVLKSSDMLNGVRNNVIHGAVATVAHYAGEDPGLGLIGDPISAFATDEDILKFYYMGGGLKVVDEILEQWGVKLIGVSMTGSESFVSKKPLRKVDDFKGVKLRAPTGPVQKLFAAFGAAPVNLPSSEVYTALDKGVIDAADASTFASNQKQGLNDIAKFPIYPGFHSAPTVHIIMNGKEWAKLSKSDQAFLQAYFKGLALESMLRPHYEDRLAVAEAVKKGIEPVTWTSDELAKVRVHARKIWTDIAAQSKSGKKFYDALIAYLTSQGQM
jgi:TRAP-type C4-dicarboxylate transport system substrate-binding protein